MQLTLCMLLLHSSLIELYNRSKKLGCCPSGTWDIISLNLGAADWSQTYSIKWNDKEINHLCWERKSDLRTSLWRSSTVQGV